MEQDNLIDVLKALAHPLRFRILGALAGGERNVGEIEQVTGILQPGLSQQLGVLRHAGLVETRKDAKLVFYAIAADRLEGAIAKIAALTEQGGSAATKGSASPITSAPGPATGPAPGAANFARMV